MVSPSCDGELDAAELTHADSAVREPGRSQMTQRKPLRLFIAILGGGGGGGGEVERERGG